MASSPDFRPYIPETDPEKVIAKLEGTARHSKITNRQMLECLVDTHYVATPFTSPQEFPGELALAREGEHPTYLEAEIANSRAERVSSYPDALVAACLYPIPGSNLQDGYGLRFWLQADGQCGGIVTQYTMEEKRDHVKIGRNLTQALKKTTLNEMRQILASYIHPAPVPVPA